MLKLAFRNLFRHKLRTGITLAAIAFGVAVIILSGGFVEDMFVQLRESTIHSQLGHIQVYKSGYYAQGRRDPYRYLIATPEMLEKKLKKLPHVAKVMARIQFDGMLSNTRADLPIEGEGVAKALQLRPGDYASLILTTPDGALNSMEFKVVGVFRSFAKDYDDHAIRIVLPTAQDLLNTRSVLSLVLLLDNTLATDKVAAALKAQLPSNEYEVKTWIELADFYGKTVELYSRYFGVMMIIILIMVLLGVLNSIILTVHERTGEFGTLMAFGNRGPELFRLIFWENILLALFACAAGLVLGVMLAKVVSAIGIPMPPPPNMNSGYMAHIRVVPTVVLTSVLTGFVAAMLAAALAARRVIRLPIIEALRHNI